MKFKGFWKGYMEVWNHWVEWLKDYWLLYIIICVVAGIIFSLPAIIDYIDYIDFTRNLEPKDEDFLD